MVKKIEDNLGFILCIWFMIAVFGHNIFGEKKMTQKEREEAWIKEILSHPGHGIMQCNETIEEEAYNNLTAKKEKKIVRHKSRPGSITVTQYNPVKEQCDEDPLVTADNSKIDLKKLKKGKLKWVAVSRDLRTKYKYGDVIEIKVKKGNRRINGRYVVHDTMHPRFTNRIDILTSVGEPIDMWCDVTVKKVGEV